MYIYVFHYYYYGFRLGLEFGVGGLGSVVYIYEKFKSFLYGDWVWGIPYIYVMYIYQYLLSSKVFYNYHYNIHNHHHHDHHRLTHDASCCTTAHLLLLHRPLPHSHADNDTDVPSVCRLLPSLLNKPHLIYLDLDHEPSSCVVDSAWAQAGLPVPPPQVVKKGWTDVLQHIREVSCCCVSEACVCAES